MTDFAQLFDLDFRNAYMTKDDLNQQIQEALDETRQKQSCLHLETGEFEFYIDDGKIIYFSCAKGNNIKHVADINQTRLH